MIFKFGAGLLMMAAFSAGATHKSDTDSLLEFPSLDPHLAQVNSQYEELWNANRNTIWQRIQTRSTLDGNPNRKVQVEFESLFQLNQQSWKIWQQLLDCHGQDIRRAREAYRTRAYCPVSSVHNQEIQDQLVELQDSISSFLVTTELEVQELQAFYGDSQRDLTLLLHPLFVQKVLEVLASLKIYFWLDAQTSEGVRWASVLKNPQYPKSSFVDENEKMIKAQLANPLTTGILVNAFKTLNLIQSSDCVYWGLWPHASEGVLEGLYNNMMNVGLYRDDQILVEKNKSAVSHEYLTQLRFSIEQNCITVLPKHLGSAPKYPGAYTRAEKKAWWNQALRAFRALATER